MEPKRSLPQLTSARHLSLSWASSTQSVLHHPTFWRSIVILSSHLRLCLPWSLFPPGFPTKTLYRPLLSPIRTTWLTHLILFDLITQTILDEDYWSLNSSLCSFLHFPGTSSLSGPHILLSAPFSNTLSLPSSLKVSDIVSQHLHITLKSDPNKFQYCYVLILHLALKTALLWLLHIFWHCLNTGLYLFCFCFDAAPFHIVQAKLIS